MPIPKAKYNVWDYLYGDQWYCIVLERHYEKKDNEYDVQWRWYRIEYLEPHDTVHEDDLSK